MKAICLAVILCCFLPVPGAADTIILKSGKSIAVKKVWEEDGHIKGELFGSVIGYPKAQVERVEINENVRPAMQKSGFRFDIWRSGFSLDEFMDIAERNDIPIHRDGLISANKHFNRAIAGNIAKRAGNFIIKIRYSEMGPG